MRKIRKKVSLFCLCVLFGVFSVTYAKDSAVPASLSQVLDGTCGIAWGAGQKTAKEGMRNSPFEATLRVEDGEILVYSGKFAGIASEFVFLFFEDQLAEGLIVIYDNSAKPMEKLEQVRQVLNEKYGDPAVTRSVNGRPEYDWFFLSPRNPLPDYAYIKLFPSRGSFIGSAEQRANRPVIIMMSADRELGEKYHDKRAKALSK